MYGRLGASLTRGLSGDDIAKLETALKAMAETPSKIDALIERVNKLEEAVKMEDNTMGVGQESQQTESADAQNTEQQLTKTEQSQNSETDKNEKEDGWKQKITEMEAGNKQTQEMIVALTAQQAAMSEGLTAQAEALTRIAQSLESVAKPAESPMKTTVEAEPAEQTTEKPDPAPAQEVKAGRKKARKAAWI